MRLALFIFPFLFFCTTAYPSQEGALKFSSFKVESKGIGGSGPVVVESQSALDGSLTGITATFLGERVQIPSDLLQKIPEHFNGLQLSYERGYTRLGGKTLYLTFTFGFVASGPEPYAQTVIAIKESGSIEILEDNTFIRER